MADITDEQIDEAWTFATGGSIVTDDMRAFARAIYALQPSEQEPVTWEWRHLDTTNTPHTWSEWARVEPRNRYTDTVDDRVREYQAYIKQGYRYELRALYASPPPVTAAREQEASATGAEPVDASRVRDEALEEAAKLCEEVYQCPPYRLAGKHCADTIRSLIGTPKEQA